MLSILHIAGKQWAAWKGAYVGNVCVRWTFRVELVSARSILCLPTFPGVFHSPTQSSHRPHTRGPVGIED